MNKTGMARIGKQLKGADLNLWSIATSCNTVYSTAGFSIA